jgi:hypothetical protein
MIVCHREERKYKTTDPSMKTFNSVWRCRRVSCLYRPQGTTWAPSRKAVTARAISNASRRVRILRRGAAGASSGHCSCRGTGQPNGFSSGCAGQEQFKVGHSNVVILLYVICAKFAKWTHCLHPSAVTVFHLVNYWSHFDQKRLKSKCDAEGQH